MMKKILIIISLLLLGSTIVGAFDNPDFNIKIYVIEEDNDNDIDVYGQFATEEGKYGGIELIYYRDTYSYSIKSIDNIEDLLMDLENPDIDMGSNIDMVIRVFLKPVLTENGMIHLTGRLQKMINTKSSGDPSFTVENEKIDLTLPNNGTRLFEIKSPQSDRTHKFELEVNSLMTKEYSSYSDDFSLNASYSLYNESDQRFEVEDDVCTLKPLKKIKDNDLLCSHYKTFRLLDGDSLLYLVTYNVENINERSDGSYDLTVLVNRHY
ncbi:MAG: hypothetical protein ABIJ45_06065, partial [Candidatus Zixiibacteriota bacterium]